MANIVKVLAPGIVVDDHGNIWQAFDDGRGLHGVDWKQIGTYFAPFVAAGAAWVASKGSQNVPQQYQQAPGGVQVGATSQGLFGGIDTTTLLLIGGAILLFMSMPPSGRR